MKKYNSEMCVHHHVSLDLQRYFNGEIIDFSCYDVGLSGLTSFEQQVLTAARSIPWGSIITYSQLTLMIGRPRATRAVGTALGKNRVPVIIPCHRVVSKSGPGGFSYGVDVKQRLLGIESIKV
ncbi:MAG: methylated-DNA--[protein]-cysteine S-methyltransferase [ANME-2 cluster archaeon]|nr:methylated-DNA--[protein]-cysteine S-methyltransferase [ANME-2 cluster archaeon]